MSKLFEEMVQGTAEARAYMEGERKGFKVTLPAEVDVKAIRKQLNMTQSRFSDTFGFSLDAVKHWEGGRRTPESSARAFLTVISKNPGAVISALHQPALHQPAIANAIMQAKADSGNNPAIANAMMVKTAAKVAPANKDKWRRVAKVAAAKRGRWRVSPKPTGSRNRAKGSDK